MKKNTQVTARKARIHRLHTELTRMFPNVGTALHYTQAHELLFAVILSAQCTDARVNIVTNTLFKKYPTLNAFAEAKKETLERDIFQTGFYKNKARSIIESAIRIREVYSGTVPCDMNELLTLRGVARKTANVFLGEWCKKVAGVVVDTHVRRFVARFDLSEKKTPDGIEKDLMQLLPPREWRAFSHRVMRYGREIAPARKYDTNTDPLVAIYPKAGERFRV